MREYTLPLSMIILTFNEEQNLESCIRSVSCLTPEIFVVDSGSTDHTIDIARKYTDKIVYHPFDNYSAQRNWAQANLPITNEWVFHIDADERVTPELAMSLRTEWTNLPDEIEGFLVTRRTEFWGRPIWHGGHYPTYHLRVFRRSRGRCEARLYDQHFVVEGKTRKIQGDLIDVISSDLTTWTMRHARWGAAEAAEQSRARESSAGDQVQANLMGDPIQRRRWMRTSLYGRAPLFLRAFGYFFYRYFLRLGFLDGTEGLVFHFLQGCWFRIYVDAKVYEGRLAEKNANV